MSKALRPTTLLQRILESELLFEVIIAGITVVGGFAAAIKLLRETPPQHALAATLFGCASALLVIQIIRAIYRHLRSKSRTRVHSLDGALHLLHAILADYMKSSSPEELRICVFAPTANPEEVFQVTDYVGTATPRGKNRRMSTSHGIVGLAARSHQAHYAHLPANTHLIDFHVENYGYSREAAAQITPDRLSWAAVPIYSGSETIAVLYVDSSIPNAFGKANSSCRRAIEAAIVGVAMFLSRTYDS